MRKNFVDLLILLSVICSSSVILLTLFALCMYKVSQLSKHYWSVLRGNNVNIVKTRNRIVMKIMLIRLKTI